MEGGVSSIDLNYYTNQSFEDKLVHPLDTHRWKTLTGENII